MLDKEEQEDSGFEVGDSVETAKSVASTITNLLANDDISKLKVPFGIKKSIREHESNRMEAKKTLDELIGQSITLQIDWGALYVASEERFKVDLAPRVTDYLVAFGNNMKKLAEGDEKNFSQEFIRIFKANVLKFSVLSDSEMEEKRNGNQCLIRENEGSCEVCFSSKTFHYNIHECGSTLGEAMNT